MKLTDEIVTKTCLKKLFDRIDCEDVPMKGFQMIRHQLVPKIRKCV